MRITLLTVILVAIPLSARTELAPRSPEQLAEHADLIVTGEVTGLTVSSERSRIERGWGNYDWIIALQIRVNDVEKGDKPGAETVTARCFRIRSRKSMIEFLSPSGHHPIPGPGAKLRAYLHGDRDSAWRVVLPNGIASIDDNTPVTDAPEVEALACGYTYLLPLGTWIVLAIIVLIIFAIVRLVRFIKRRRATRQEHTKR